VTYLADSDLTNQGRLASIRLRELRTAEAQTILISQNIQQAQPQLAGGLGGARKSINLPTLVVPNFSGKENWNDFWNIYSVAVDEDVDLPSIRKFVYLKSRLEGEAKQLIDGINLTEPNYATAVRILKDRYGNEDATVRSLHKELVRVKPSVKFADDANLLLLADKVCRQLITHVHIHTFSSFFI
jgi:hypothetical protein